MANVKKNNKKSDKSTWIVYGIISALFFGAIGFGVKIMMSDTGPRQKTQIATVNLIKTPPPPEKEKPPEPQIQKEVPKQQQEVMEQAQAPQPGPQNDQPDDGPKAGSDLGVDADGGAGSDGFGLVGKKGGRSITLGGGGGGGGGLSKMALLSKYGWYTKKVEKELWSKVKQILDKDGGIPKGKHLAMVNLQLNGGGTVLSYKLVGPTGDDRIDRALKTALAGLKVSEPPPSGMPGGMTIKISAQG